MEQSIKIGLLGAGTVGSGVVKVLRENMHEIEQKTGTRLEVKKILVRNIGKRKDEKFLQGIELTTNIDDIINDDEIQIVVEVMGGIHPAYDFMLKAMNAKKHVVTANKDVVSSLGKNLFEASEKNHVAFMFEASVGGGIPIITPMKECLTANKISEVMGIVNGTTNYMLTKMTDERMDYETVLKQAQAKGYAEANPVNDVGGLDAARKIAILASLAFTTRITADQVNVEGITKITPQDIEYATQLGYVIKLLAIAKEVDGLGVDVRVHSALLPKQHPLASVNDVFNAIFIKGNAIGEAMFYGRGAGEKPTASAVLADIIAIAREIVKGIHSAIGCTCFEHKPLCPIEETKSAYYIRLLVSDSPGVLGMIATTFGNQSVSLHSVIQTRCVGKCAEIVVITHDVKHRQIIQAENALKNLHVVKQIANVIRVIHLIEENEDELTAIGAAL